MTVTSLWSAGVDFDQTFLLVGGVKTPWAITLFTVPGGLPLLASNLLLMAFSVRETPGTQIWESSGAGADQITTFRQNIPPGASTAQTTILTAGSPAKGGGQFNSGAAFSLAGSTLATTGITISIGGQFLDASEQIEGTAVACIFGVDNSTAEAIQSLVPDPLFPSTFSINTQTTAPPAIGGATLVTSGVTIDGGAGTVASVANSGSATLPGFTGDANWIDVLSRTNGAFGAAIGQYVSAVDPGVPLDFNVGYSRGEGQIFMYEFRHAGLTVRRRGFAQVVG